MKLVSIEVKPAREGDLVIATIVEQRHDGNSWRETKRHKVRSDEVGRQRTLLLEENERIVVEERNERVVVDGRSQVETVVNKEEMAAVSQVAVMEVMAAEEPLIAPGPLPPGHECQIGVWREAGEQPWSRTGARYRIY